MISSEPAAITITPRYEPWPTNGSEFCFAAGRSADRTTRTPTLTRCVDAGLCSQRILLDGATQMSMPPAPMAETISYGPRRVPGPTGIDWRRRADCSGFHTRQREEGQGLKSVPCFRSQPSNRRVQSQLQHAHGSAPFSSRHWLRACASLMLSNSKNSSQ